jgi:uncharacterized protein
MSELDDLGRSPLHYAARDNKATEAVARLSAGDDPDLADRDGFTALHFAAQEGAVEVARLLLDNGAYIDRVNKYGNTALFIAVYNSNGEGDLISLLREHGADPLSANNSGQAPVGLARQIANVDVARFFVDVPVS